MVWVFATLMFEMAACMPLHGAGADTYATRLLSRSFGFAMGWNYWYAYAMLVPFEVTAATLVVGYWSPPVPDAVLITVLVVAVAGLNYLPVGHSGEAEFVFSSLKVGMLTGIMILSVVVAAGGGPTGDRLAFRYWRDPGPANPWLVAGGKGEIVSFIGVLVSVVLPVTSARSSPSAWTAANVCSSSPFWAKWSPCAEARRRSREERFPERPGLSWSVLYASPSFPSFSSR